MALKDALLPEFDQEMAGARKVLERVPTDKFGWKPHAKSWTMGELAVHVAHIPSWMMTTVTTASLDMAPGGEPVKWPDPPTTTEGLLALFDDGVKQARAAIESVADDGLWGQPWSLLTNGHVHLTMPKAAVARFFVMNHLVHHRAQLGVYLRLNDIPVPSVYGPTADEPGM